MGTKDFLRGTDGNRLRDRLPDPSLDDTFRILANRRRRCLLQLLKDYDTPRFWLANLALELAAIEEHMSSTDPPSQRALMIELQHNHLPLLADADVIEYDPERTTGRYVGDPALESLLEWKHSHTDAVE